MWVLLLIGILCSGFSVYCMPNGAPPKSCFYMTPRHIHPHTQRKVFPTQANGLYNITVSSDYFRPDRPIQVTLWGPPFKGFMIVGAEEGAKDWPTGVFYSDDGSAEKMTCLGHGDTATHVNNSYKDSVSLLWYGPDNMAVEQVQFIATVVVNVTIYYTNIRSGWVRVDPTLQASRQGGDGGPLGVTMDPWLLGQEQVDPWSTGRGTGTGGNLWGGTGTGGTSWSNTGTGGSLGLGNLWGNTGWGTSGTSGTKGTASQWDWNNQGSSSQGKGAGTSWNWNNQGQSTGKGTSTGSGSGSNWNLGQTTTAAWDTKTRAWEQTTTEAPVATQAPGLADTNQPSSGSATADTKQSSIDWIKNIPTQTWYEILRRLGFNVDSSSAGTSSKQTTV